MSISFDFLLFPLGCGFAIPRCLPFKTTVFRCFWYSVLATFCTVFKFLYSICTHEHKDYIINIVIIVCNISQNIQIANHCEPAQYHRLALLILSKYLQTAYTHLEPRLYKPKHIYHLLKFFRLLHTIQLFHYYQI